MGIRPLKTEIFGPERKSEIELMHERLNDYFRENVMQREALETMSVDFYRRLKVMSLNHMDRVKQYREAVDRMEQQMRQNALWSEREWE